MLRNAKKSLLPSPPPQKTFDDELFHSTGVSVILRFESGRIRTDQAIYERIDKVQAGPGAQFDLKIGLLGTFPARCAILLRRADSSLPRSSDSTATRNILRLFLLYPFPRRCFFSRARAASTLQPAAAAASVSGFTVVGSYPGRIDSRLVVLSIYEIPGTSVIIFSRGFSVLPGEVRKYKERRVEAEETGIKRGE